MYPGAAAESTVLRCRKLPAEASWTGRTFTPGEHVRGGTRQDRRDYRREAASVAGVVRPRGGQAGADAVEGSRCARKERRRPRLRAPTGSGPVPQRQITSSGAGGVWGGGAARVADRAVVPAPRHPRTETHRRSSVDGPVSRRRPWVPPGPWLGWGAVAGRPRSHRIAERRPLLHRWEPSVPGPSVGRFAGRVGGAVGPLPARRRTRLHRARNGVMAGPIRSTDARGLTCRPTGAAPPRHAGPLVAAASLGDRRPQTGRQLPRTGAWPRARGGGWLIDAPASCRPPRASCRSGFGPCGRRRRRPRRPAGR